MSDFNNQHPITPPSDLVEQWYRDSPEDDEQCYIATQAARWGADQELEACWEWLHRRCLISGAEALRAARRPKPPSLKEQALEALQSMQIDPVVINGVNINAYVIAKYDTIRRALEQLDD